ncbi:MAG: DUF2993 domain-containing protein [Leptolyngbyaceae cyanobacterium bins.59]|nr:DUF2993 domain-containing protein [Leptolyngbyaceae cyanobacterium bins.59]
MKRDGVFRVTQEKASLGEQALSKAAKVGITTQLDAVEQLDVDIRTDPVKAVQGRVDSVAIDATGMVMQKDLRMEEMHLQTGKIAVNPLSVAFGKIELTHPTEATSQVILTEEDLNRAFNSDYIHGKLQNLSVHLDDRPTKVNVQAVELHLLGDCQLSLKASVLIQETQERKKVCFTATPRVKEGGTGVVLEDVQYPDDQPRFSPELTQALLEKASDLLDLQNFELPGMKLTLNHMDVEPGRLILQADALVEQFPS